MARTSEPSEYLSIVRTFSGGRIGPSFCTSKGERSRALRPQALQERGEPPFGAWAAPEKESGLDELELHQARLAVVDDVHAGVGRRWGEVGSGVQDGGGEEE